MNLVICPPRFKMLKIYLEIIKTDNKWIWMIGFLFSFEYIY